MKNFALNHFTLIIVFAFIAGKPANCQIPDFSKVPLLYENDSISITDLIQHGLQITRKKVICWFPRDSFPEQRMNEIADTINLGIAATENLLNAPLAWQAHKFNEPYIFYFRTDTFISHASLAGFVSVPFWRIKNGKAPWLHEVLHEMLKTKTGSWNEKKVKEEYWSMNMPLWLFEGLPDYISMIVSQANNLQWYDVFSKSSQMNIDSIFIGNMKEGTEHTSYILSYIGEKGVMPELFSNDRISYAPGFYHGSCSFVQYISVTYGINVLLEAISSFQKEQETIEKLCGKPLAVLKNEWLEKLKLSK